MTKWRPNNWHLHCIRANDQKREYCQGQHWIYDTARSNCLTTSKCYVWKWLSAYQFGFLQTRSVVMSDLSAPVSNRTTASTKPAQPWALTGTDVNKTHGRTSQQNTLAGVLPFNKTCPVSLSPFLWAGKSLISIPASGIVYLSAFPLLALPPFVLLVWGLLGFGSHIKTWCLPLKFDTLKNTSW